MKKDVLFRAYFLQGKVVRKPKGNTEYLCDLSYSGDLPVYFDERYSTNVEKHLGNVMYLTKNDDSVRGITATSYNTVLKARMSHNDIMEIRDKFKLPDDFNFTVSGRITNMKEYTNAARN